MRVRINSLVVVVQLEGVPVGRYVTHRDLYELTSGYGLRGATLCRIVFILYIVDTYAGSTYEPALHLTLEHAPGLVVHAEYRCPVQFAVSLPQVLPASYDALPLVMVIVHDRILKEPVYVYAICPHDCVMAVDAFVRQQKLFPHKDYIVCLVVFNLTISSRITAHIS